MSLASVEYYKLTTLDKMILLVVLSKLDVSSTQLKRGFNFPFKFIYGQPVTRSRIWELWKARMKSSQGRKEICIRTTVETTFLMISQINFQSKQSCFVIFRYKFTITQGNFQSDLWKHEL